MDHDGDQPGRAAEPPRGPGPRMATPAAGGAAPADSAPGRGGPQWWGGPPWRGGPPPWRDGRPPWADGRGRPTRHGTVILVLFVYLVEVVGTMAAAHHQVVGHKLDAAGYWLMIAGVLPLLFRARARVPMFLVTLSATVVYVIVGYPYGPVFFALLISIFGAVRAGHLRFVWCATLVGYAAVVVLPHFVHSIGGVHLHAPSVFTSIFIGAWVLVAIVVAQGLRLSAAQFTAANRARAEQARSRAEQERRQASEERLRIARELHDVLGHHLTLINVRAGVGLHLMAEDPAQARSALEAIKVASSEALGEVRTVLDMLRAPDEAAPHTPAPGLDDLRSLVDGADTTIVGDVVPLPPEVDRAAYRIIQESLTNVRRHAGEGAHASVTLTYRPDKLVVRIADDGAGAPGWVDPADRVPADPVDPVDPADPAAGAQAMPDGAGPAPDEAGNGIAGMRARAAALGGTLTAGPGATRGFVVTATLPIRETI